MIINLGFASVDNNIHGQKLMSLMSYLSRAIDVSIRMSNVRVDTILVHTEASIERCEKISKVHISLSSEEGVNMFVPFRGCNNTLASTSPGNIIISI